MILFQIFYSTNSYNKNKDMLIGLIPDVHQSTHFIKMVEENIDHLDKLVFLGDYVDNWQSTIIWHIPENNPINIISKIVSYKKKYGNKIDLLLGNHCLSYISQNPISKLVSGHQQQHDKEIAQAYLDNLEHFKIAVKYDKWIISHAGFSKTWVKNQILNGWNKKQSIIDWCNKMIQEKYFDYFNWTGKISPSGDEVTQTPTWIRPFSLVRDSYFKNQIVGHSEAPFAPLFIKNRNINLILVDSPKHNSYFELDTNNLPKFETIKNVLTNIKKRKK